MPELDPEKTRAEWIQLTAESLDRIKKSKLVKTCDVTLEDFLEDLKDDIEYMIDIREFWMEQKERGL